MSSPAEGRIGPFLRSQTRVSIKLPLSGHLLCTRDRYIACVPRVNGLYALDSSISISGKKKQAWKRLTNSSDSPSSPNSSSLQSKLEMETRSECKQSQLGGLHQAQHRVTTTSMVRADLRPAEDSHTPTPTAGFCSAFHPVRLQLKLPLPPQLL